ncbi:MAG: transglutaminase family protein [Salinarimonadaceae bacterium]|nr:MAG: transglutaminase family protein [Salinarimonadaceae bacterium]
MRVRIEHETHYVYEAPIRSLIQILRMTPRSHDGQHVRSWRIEPSIDGRVRRDEDALGNIVHHFSADRGAEELTLRVVGEIETSDTAGLVKGAVTRAPDAYFLRDTELTEADEALRAFASDVTGDIKGDTLAGLHRLMNAINARVLFDTEPTHVATTAREAFAMSTGVCQDLTHIFIACARSLDIPARYVSGYFFRADGVVEQDAGHAWAEVRIPELGWVAFDPTNGICTTEAHVRVAIGLDYLGAAPIRGSRWGGGGERMDVRLSVENADRAAPEQ